MTSNRPYQGPISPSQAIQELKKCAGTQFDPELVEIFVGTVLSDSPGTDNEHDTKADSQESCDQGSPSH
jgi:HD-GYP domain-containing protein (c-di-GMP phosphodiesterase class II)